MNIAIVVLAIVLIVVLAWNFYPPFRQRMRGLSTKLEALVGLLMYWLEIFQDALRQLHAEGWLPDGWESAVPYILGAYIIMKRWQTTTPVLSNK